MSEDPQIVTVSLADVVFSPTAALFEGGTQAGTGTSIFVVRTPPGSGVDLHTHPYPETFVLLEGRGRWTAGDAVVELEPDHVLVVPPNTPHGFATSATRPCSSSPCTSRAPSIRGSSGRIRIATGTLAVLDPRRGSGLSTG